MLATSTPNAASILELARNKLRNIHATTTEKGAQHPPLENAELVAPFSLDERGALEPDGKSLPDPDDNRRRCTQCANLSAAATCRAARTLGAAPGYQPVDLPRRCRAYQPGLHDPDRRSGAERWHYGNSDDDQPTEEN